MDKMLQSQHNTMIRMDKKHHFIKGLKMGIPIAIGYIPIAVTFGLLVKSTKIPLYVGTLMSLLVFAGASQFVSINLFAFNAGCWEIIMTTFILNFRHFLMTASISRRIDRNIPKGVLAFLSFGITDETFSIASLQKDEMLHPMFVLGLNLIAYGAWNVGTWIGLFMATALPSTLQNSMGIALYAMFIGLLVPSAKKSKPIFICAVLAMGIHILLQWCSPLEDYSSGWNIIISTIVTAAFAAFYFKEEETLK